MQIFIFFISWVVWTLIVAWFSVGVLKPHVGRPYPVHFDYIPSFFNHFMHWDAVWYTHIAVYGYRYSTVHIPTIAFFPGYSIIMKFIYILFHKNIAILYILPSLVFQALSIYMLYLLLKHLNKPIEVIYMVLILYTFYPSSFFAMSAYPVSALNFFAISTFLFIERKQYLVASIMAGIGTLFGPMAVFLSIAIVFDILKTRKTIDYIKVLPYALLSLSGFLVFVGYNYYKFKDPIAFIKAQEYWGKPSIFEKLYNIIALIPHDIPTHPLSTPLGIYEFDHFINLVILIVYVFVIVMAIDKIPFHYSIFSVFIVIEYLWALGGIFINTSAFARLSYISVPLFISLSEILEEYPFSIGVFAPLFFMSNFILEALFVRNYWSI